MKMADDGQQGDETTGQGGSTDDASLGETPGDDSAASDGTGGDQANDDEVVVTIGEEAPPQNEEEQQPAPAWVKELRKADKEKARKIRELEQQLAATKVAETAAQVTLTRPTLAGCDYDEEAFEAKLLQWQGQQAAAAAEQQKKVDTEKAEADAWQAKLTGYEGAKTALKVADFEDAEAVAGETLSVTQRGIILSGADNPALVIYALGKNQAKLKELASIKDPVKYAFAVSKLEAQLKVTPRKAPPPPEERVRGSAPVAVGGDATLERLRAEAAKSGDMSKVIAYNRQKRAA